MSGGVALGRSSRAGDAARDLDRARFGKGIAFGIAAGISFGVSSFLISAGVKETQFPVAGAVISYGFSLVGYLILLESSGISLPDFEITLRLPRLNWFILDGSLRAGAAVTMYIALQSTVVVIVSPVVATQSLFGILFSYLTIRKVEVFHVAVILGATLALLGVIVIYLPPI